MVAVVLTGFLAALSFRDAFLRPVQHAQWLLPLAFMLPNWAGRAVNIAFYGYLLWAGVLFFRFAQGKERIVVVAWFLIIMLYPVEIFGSHRAAVAIKYVEAAAMAVAFFAALDILLRSVGRDKAQA